ncbi:MAG: hypothetical protein ACYDAE_21620 [Steroidobacteraceae bacterium]
MDYGTLFQMLAAGQDPSVPDPRNSAATGMGVPSAQWNSPQMGFGGQWQQNFMGPQGPGGGGQMPQPGAMPGRQHHRGGQPGMQGGMSPFLQQLLQAMQQGRMGKMGQQQQQAGGGAIGSLANPGPLGQGSVTLGGPGAFGPGMEIPYGPGGGAMQQPGWMPGPNQPGGVGGGGGMQPGSWLQSLFGMFGGQGGGMPNTPGYMPGPNQGSIGQQQRR